MAEALTYRKDIDGLRAIAVIPVVLFHAGFSIFSGGYIGVDIFFVISGYLISSIILKEMRQRSFTLAGFYERRIRRIFPALFFMLIVVCVIAGIFYTPRDFNEVGKSLYSVLLFFSNFHFMQSQGYFNSDADLQLFLHTWSLSVEEQFYIFFPILLVVLGKFRNSTRATVIVALLVVSLGAASVTAFFDIDVAFYSSPLRFWELLSGVLLAIGVLPLVKNTRLLEVLAFFGLALILGSVFLYDRETIFPGLAAIPACLGALLIIYTGSIRATSVSRILSHRVLVFFGLISYSLYLWHWPIFVFRRYLYLEDSVLVSLVLVLLSVVLAWVSFRFVERPFRVKKPFRLADASVNPAFRIAGVSVVLMLSIAAGLDISDGFPQRYSSTVQSMTHVTYRHPKFRLCGSVRPGEADKVAECSLGDKTAEFQFALWGDSHAEMLAPLLDSLAAERGIRGHYFSKSSCPPFFFELQTGESDEAQRCSKYHNTIIDYLENAKVKDVIIAASWSSWSGEPGNDFLTRGLAPMLSRLEDGGVRVWLVHQVPESGIDVPRVLLRNLTFPGTADAEFSLNTSLQNQAAYRAQVLKLQTKYNFEELFPEKILCANNVCPVEQNHHPLYKDENHISVYGAMSLADLFLPVFDLK